MKRLLGIVHMNPEVDPSAWNHAEEEKVRRLLDDDAHASNPARKS